MKKVDVKSLFSKRLIPLLIVPTLLGSNFISIQALADGQESIVEAVESEQPQESVSEEPVVEETTVTEEQPVEVQPVEEQEETAQSTEASGDDTTENQQVDPENSTTEYETSEEETQETKASEEASDEASLEVSDEASDEASDDAAKETSKDTEEDLKKSKESKKDKTETENKVVVSVADFTFPVELVVEGAVEESKVEVYAVSEDGTQQQLSEGEPVDVKVDGVEVVTTQTVEVSTGKTNVTLDDESDDSAAESEDEGETEAASENNTSEEATVEKAETGTETEKAEDVTVSETVTEGSVVDETVEVVTKEDETATVSFGYDIDESFYEIESITLDGEELDLVDGILTADIDTENFAGEYLETSLLTVKLSKTPDNLSEVEKIIRDAASFETEPSAATYGTVYAGTAPTLTVSFDKAKLENITITDAKICDEKATVDSKNNKITWTPATIGYYPVNGISVSYKYEDETHNKTESGTTVIPYEVLFCKHGAKIAGDTKLDGFTFEKKVNDWYSTNNGDLVLTYTGTSSVEVETATVAIAGVDAGNISAEISNDKKWDGDHYLINFTAKITVKKSEEAAKNIKDGTVECPVELTFKTGNEKVTEKTYDGNKNCEVKVDSSAPELDGVELRIQEIQGTHTFWDYINVLNWFNKDYEVEVLVPVDCDTGSGISQIDAEFTKSFFFGSVTTERAKSVVISPSTKKIEIDGVKYYVLTHQLTTKDDESAIYGNTSVKLTDVAGNTASISKSCNIGIDKSAPKVEYYANDAKVDTYTAVTCDDDVNRIFFKSNIAGKVEVTDDNLDPEKIVVNADKAENNNIYALVNYSATGNVPTFTLSEEMGKETYGFSIDGKTSSTRITRMDYLFNIEEYGEYTIYAQVQDKAGNKMKEPKVSQKVVLDNKAPDVAISASFGTPAGKDSTYTNAKDITITATVTEDWLDTANSKLKVKVTHVDGTETEEEGSEWTHNGGVYTATYSVSQDGSYEPYVEAIDYAGNETHHNVASEGFTYDGTAPKVTISFDNNDVKNSKYYNAKRVATITVDDFTFDANATDLKLDEVRGKASESVWNTDSRNIYSKQVTFDQDGRYSFSFKCTDKAGNVSGEESVTEFVIDKTEPKITVSYTGGTAKNEMYYKDARTATIQIDEMSFDANSVEYKTQELAEAAALPVLGNFSSSEDINTASVTFDKDGKYGYVINCTDLAGNSCSSYISDVFVIDTTVPEVTFSGVENFSANNGVVAPVVTYSDKYMDMQATTVKMTGSNNGAVSLGSTTAQIENGFVVSYSDFAHDKSVDDLYTFEATVVDLAGNETKGELVFSVNRYGSVFVLGDGTKALNEKYYTNQAQDIVITEINVDTLTYRDVSINRDGDITNLSKDKDYSVAKQGSDTSWKTYTYTISKDNFKKDGVYSVTVYTEDRATNVQDNKSRDAEVNFAIDSTKPSIVTSGIENGLKKDNTESYDFNLDVTDNMMLKSLAVYDNNETIATYDQDQLLNNTDTKVITLKGSDDGSAQRTITIEAEDLAGNKETLVYSNVIVTKAAVAGAMRPGGNGNGNGDGKDGDNNNDNDQTNPISAVIWVIVGLGAVAIAGGSGVVLYRKKK